MITRKADNDRLVEIRAFYEEVGSLVKVAEKFCISVPTASKYVKLAGGKVRSRGRPKVTVEHVARDVNVPATHVPSSSRVADVDW